MTGGPVKPPVARKREVAKWRGIRHVQGRGGAVPIDGSALSGQHVWSERKAARTAG